MSQVTAEMIAQGRRVGTPTHAAHRRRNAQHMRDARERLTSSGPGDRNFAIDLLHGFAENQSWAVLLQMCILALATTLMTCWMQPLDILAWPALVVPALGAALLVSRRFRSTDASTVSVKRWKRRFVMLSLLQSIAWSSLAILSLINRDSAAQTCILLTLLAQSAIAALLFANVRSAVYATLLPSTVAILFLLRPVWGLAAFPQALLALGAQVFCILVARRIFSISVANFSAQAERDASIVELEQARLNSDEARRRAEEANLAKSRFLATMSHELRTPLNAILGFSEVMKSELFGPHAVPLYKEYSNDVHSSGQHLLMLINEILDLSRVEAGRYDLREESVSLAHIVQECRHLMALRANKRQITLNEMIERTLPRIWVDERAMRQVVLNLLSNAIKFTPQGGAVAIKVGATPQGGQFVSIRDTGPGIPEAEIPIVMSSFGRGTLAQKNAEEGSGLGLPIVKGLVEMHGGLFTLKSVVREGTEVIVTLPPERVIEAMPQLKLDDGTTEPPRRRPSVRSAA